MGAGTLAAVALLVAQNSALTMAMKAAMSADGARFLPTVVVLCSEALKCTLVIAALVVVDGKGHWRPALEGVRKSFSDARSEIVLVAVPAFLYTVQNSLAFVAVAHLDAAT